MHILVFVLALATSLVTSLQAQWARVGPQGGAVTGLAKTAHCLFAATHGHSFPLSHGSGVFRSSDSGATWVQVNRGLNDSDVRAIASTGTTLVALTESQGLFQSTDDGLNWDHIKGLSARDSLTNVCLNCDQLIATQQSGRKHRSTDQGLTWNGDPIGPHGNCDVNGGRYISFDSGTLYRSTNRGGSWSAIATNVYDYFSLGTLLFIGIQDSAESLPRLCQSVSSDFGDSWRVKGCPGTNSPEDTVLFKVNGTTILASSQRTGLWLSFDSGYGWWNPQLPAGSSFADMGPYLFAGNDAGVSWSLNRLESEWEPANEGMYMFQTPAPSNSPLFAVGPYIVGAQDGKLVRSSDNGRNWVAEPIELPAEARDEGWMGLETVFYGETAYSMEFQSADSGVSWSILNNSIPSTEETNLAWDEPVVQSASHPRTSAQKTRGTFWKLVNNGLDYLCEPGRVIVTALGARGNELSILTYGNHIFHSTDFGSHWWSRNSQEELEMIHPMDEEADFSEGSISLAVDTLLSHGRKSPLEWPVMFNGYLRHANGRRRSGTTEVVTAIIKRDSNIVVGTRYGVIQSRDWGASWKLLNDGLWNTSVVSFAIFGDNLLMSTHDGVWSRPLSQLGLAKQQ